MINKNNCVSLQGKIKAKKMIDYSNIRIEQVVVHQVGNKMREEEMIVSQELLEMEESLEMLLQQYFLKSFGEHNEIYHFVHPVEEVYNELRGISENFFEDTSLFYEASTQILTHLYDQSNHPHIKAGELFVVHFEDILIEDEIVRGLGVFKAESKDAFLRILASSQQVMLSNDHGINVKKLDKGCIVFNTDKEDGYRVVSVDNNRYDAEYWKQNFLSIDYIQDHNYETKNYVEMCKSFANDVIREKESKKEQIDFLNQSVQYFDSNDSIDTAEFSNEIFGTNDDLRQDFMNYKEAYSAENDVIIPDEFAISKLALEKQKRKIKNFIKLDTNIQIKLDFKNPNASRAYIEKGFDNDRGMNYYKVFYNNELD